jgi:phage I-like protein
MRKEILNRAGELPADGWLHLVAPGDVRISLERDNGEPVTLTQVYDRDGMQAMVNRFASDQQAAGERWAGLLLDWDHFSSDTDKPSEAAGWIMELQLRDDGVWGRVDWSDAGKAAVLGKRYKFASATHGLNDVQILGGGRVRPVHLKKAALTNEHRNKMLKPYDPELLNRAADGLPPEETKKGDHMDYKAMLLKLLALPAEATDETIQNACASRDQEMTNRAAEVTTLKTSVTALTADLVERDLKDFAGVIKDADGIRAALLQNRDGTLKVLRGLAVSPEGKLLQNRDGKQPETKADSGAKSTEQRTLIVEIQNRDKCDFQQAWDIARREKPELFA